ncbi:MAG: SDR family NAD(P)-dependent oxidoreductase [Bacteroidota bacterium]
MSSTPILTTLQQNPPGRRKQILADFIRQLLAQFLALDSPEEITVDQSFIDLGTDSMQAVDFKSALETQLACSLRTTLLFDYPRLDLLVNYLLIDVLKLVPADKMEQPDAHEAKQATDGSNTIDRIAIVGMACRMPGGAMTPEDFWALQIHAINAIEEVPASRWNVEQFYSPEKKPGMVSNRHGGFIDFFDSFDAQFFGLSPKEATEMDPQQRVLMEVIWEALENAGQSPQALKGSDTGVFIGIRNTEYYVKEGKRDPKNINLYSATGTQLSAASGRISYTLGLKGPSVSMDTACSASLVALHFACESLRHGESSAAIVGTVNLIISEELNIAGSQGDMLSTDGLCKSFSANANGYVRSEACTAIFLKRLSDAQKDNDPILAVLCATGVNQDGASGGLTVPNGPSQEMLITRTLAKAGVAPGDISYVEAHGTGTSLGDPIEVGALNNALGKARTKANPLIIGSVKTNIGHTEPAAGLCGLVKVVLAMQHDTIPQNLHHSPPNPYIPWDEIPIVVAKENTPWPREAKGRFAGLSSFGFTGTNAHAILTDAPLVKKERVAIDRPLHLLVLSAKTKPALQELAKRYLTYFSSNSADSLADICYTAATGRAHLQNRLSIISESRESFCQALENFLQGKQAVALSLSETSPQVPEVAFLFPAEASFYTQMGKELYATQPLFRKTLQQCDDLLKPYLQKSLLSVLWDNDQPLIEPTYRQAGSFALGYALAQCWVSWGVAPGLLLGHGIGEYIAACMADVFSIEEALKLVVYRSRLDNTASTSEAFEKVAQEITYHTPQKRIVSGITGELIGEEMATASYWVRQVSAPIRINESIAILKKEKCSICLEIGPSTPLSAKGKESVSTDEIIWLSGLQQGITNWWPLLRTIQMLFANGIPFHWANFEKGSNHTKVRLPNYPFQRQRYWIESGERQVKITEKTSRKNQVSHPLLGKRIHLAKQPTPSLHFESFLYSHQPDFLSDHRVYDSVVVPGAAYLEMALAAGAAINKSDAGKSANLYVSDVAIREILTLSPESETLVQCSLQAAADKDTYDFQIHSLFEPAEEESNPPSASFEPIWKLHASGKIHWGKQDKLASPSDTVTEIKSRCTQEKSKQVHYQEVAAAGLHYGPAFQGIEHIWYSNKEAVAEIHLPTKLSAELVNYQFHPALLDACFQTFGALLTPATKGETFLPVGVSAMEVYQQPGARVWAHLIRTGGDATHRVSTADLHLMDEQGELIAFVRGLKLLRVHRNQLRPNQEINKKMLYAPAWQLQQEREVLLTKAERAVQDPASWLILSDKGGWGERIAEKLQAQQERVIEVYKNDLDFTKVGAWDDLLLDELGDGFPALCGIINFWGLDQTEKQEGLQSTLHLVQALTKVNWEATSRKEPPRIWLVTRGAQAVESNFEAMHVEQATLWGMRSSLAAEQPAYKPVCVDLDPQTYPNKIKVETDRLFEELWLPDRESQIAYRGESRFVARLVRIQSDKTSLSIPDSSPFQLRIKEYGVLQNLEVVAYTPQSPQQGEVQIAVSASALNFKDVLHTLGMLKEYSEQLGIHDAKDQPLGFECSGTIVVVGEGVEGYRVGDAVIASAPQGCMKSLITVPTSFITRKSDQLSWEEAAALPTVFLTALYGLEQLAKIKEGDRILIHACAGGVGQAALQLAKRAGATIFATASKGKWDFLKSQGIEHIMDSRSLDFAQQVKTLTHGEGVDIVLNSLRGEYIPKSLEVLAKNGRFVEIGKIDIWSPEQMKNERPDVEYFAFDLGDECRKTPALYATLLAKMTAGFEEGIFKALPVTNFPLSQAVEAFQYLAQAKNIGKVVLSLPEVGKYQATETPSTIKPNHNYLITGGLGALGLQVARFLSEHGATHLTLVGRQAPSEKAKLAMAQLQKEGVQVEVFLADVSQVTEAQALFQKIDATLSVPLAGLVHAAGVLDDGVLSQQTWERFSAVLAPKVAGAWNLHQLTQDRPLDFFVCFSSMASLVGSSGQSNYAAANAFLDSLAHYRHGLGLPALSINWGPWADSGMAAAMTARNQQRIRSMGLQEIAIEEGLQILNALLSEKQAQVGVTKMDWTQFFSSQQQAQQTGFLADFVPSVEKKEAVSLIDELERMPADKRKQRLYNHIRAQIATVLGFASPEDITARQQLFDLGIDSLLSVDLQNRIEADLHCRLSASLIFDYPTLETLTDYLLKDVLHLATEAPEENIPEKAPAQSEENRLTEEISNLTEEELTMELLKAIQEGN